MGIKRFIDPEPPEPVEVENIIEYKSGKVEISFAPVRKSKSLRIKETSTTNTFNTARKSLDQSSLIYHKNINLRGLKEDSTYPYQNMNMNR